MRIHIWNYFENFRQKYSDDLNCTSKKKKKSSLPVMSYKVPGDQVIDYFAISSFIALYTNSSLTISSRYHCAHLSEDHFVCIIYTNLCSRTSQVIIHGLNKINCRQHKTVSWILKCTWQQILVLCSKTEKAQWHHVFSGESGFSSIEWINDIQEGVSNFETMIQIHFEG